MISTLVGYSGGTTESPTYRRIGDHSESIRIEYDPEIITYGQLLDEFMAGHDVCSPSWSTQYKSAVFFHDEDQHRAARDRLDSHGCRRAEAPSTVVEAAGPFYPAEDYHQKYYLRMHSPMFKELQAMFPDPMALALSTAAARLNAIIGGYGSPDEIRELLPSLGLSERAAVALQDMVDHREAQSPGVACPIRL